MTCILLSLSNVKPPSPTPSSRKMWIYQQADFEAANDELATYHLDESYSVDSAWGGWYSNFMSVMSKTILSRQRRRVNNHPYLSPNLLKLIHKKNLLFKAAKRLSTDKA